MHGIRPKCAWNSTESSKLEHLQFVELYKSFHVCLLSIMAKLKMLLDISKTLVFLAPFNTRFYIFKFICQIFKISTENSLLISVCGYKIVIYLDMAPQDYYGILYHVPWCHGIPASTTECCVSTMVYSNHSVPW